MDGKRSNSGGMAPLMICVCMALTACGGGSSSQAGNANLDTGSQTDITQSNLSPLIDGGEDTSQITPQITPQSTPQSAPQSAPQLAAAVPDLDGRIFEIALASSDPQELDSPQQEVLYRPLYLQLESGSRMNELLKGQTIKLSLTNATWDKRYFNLTNPLGHICEIAENNSDAAESTVLLCSYPGSLAINSTDGTTLFRVPVHVAQFEETMVKAVVELPETLSVGAGARFETSLNSSRADDFSSGDTEQITELAKTLLSLGSSSALSNLDAIPRDCLDSGAAETVYISHGFRSSFYRRVYSDCGSSENNLTGQLSGTGSDSFSDVIAYSDEDEVFVLDGSVGPFPWEYSDNYYGSSISGTLIKQKKGSLVQIRNLHSTCSPHSNSNITWNSETEHMLLGGNTLNIDYRPFEPEAGFVEATSDNGNSVIFYLDGGPIPALFAALSIEGITQRWALPLPEGVSFDCVTPRVLTGYTPNQQTRFNLSILADSRNPVRLGDAAAKAIEDESGLWVSASASPRALKLLAGRKVTFDVENAYWNLDTLPSQCFPETTSAGTVEMPSSSVTCSYSNPISILNAGTSRNGYFDLDLMYDADESAEITVNASLPEGDVWAVTGTSRIQSDAHTVEASVSRPPPLLNNPGVSVEAADMLSEIETYFAIATGKFVSPLGKIQIPDNIKPEVVVETHSCTNNGTRTSVTQRDSELLTRWEHDYDNCAEGRITNNGKITVTESPFFKRTSFSDASVFNETGSQILSVEKSISITRRFSLNDDLVSVFTESVGSIEVVDEAETPTQFSNFQSKCGLLAGEPKPYLLGSLDQNGETYFPENASIRYTINDSVLGGEVGEHLVTVVVDNSSSVRLKVWERDSSYGDTLILSAVANLSDQPTLSFQRDSSDNTTQWTIPLPSGLEFGCGFIAG